MTTWQPKQCLETPPVVQRETEPWVTILSSPCTFPPDIFRDVMLDVIRNPNVISSLLFRADILHDSNMNKDPNYSHEARPASLPGWYHQRTIVCALVPRNPQLDRPLQQTCHFLQRNGKEAVLYLPHVARKEDMPFYHPAVSALAFTHQQIQGSDTYTLAISYGLFKEGLSTKLERTALRMLQTVHKHGQGRLAGYQKRVQLDRLVPQKRYQDTYARLKKEYGRQLAEQWVEVTDPGKHVFEDLGIAAFLIELWRDMYGDGDFPGFVDVGCGNGLLVYILSVEGYTGWGLDARERKTWGTFPPWVRERLRKAIIVPQILQTTDSAEEDWHNGVFKPGTFIVSNHADELTAWTPLLARLNKSNFIAIPCCSHSLTGARFRAPGSAYLPQQLEEVKGNGPETGSLKQTEAQRKMPSAYSSLCAYVSKMGRDAGFNVDEEVLRIPSTRNRCIVGRLKDNCCVDIKAVVERETNQSILDVGNDWISRTGRIRKKPPSGH
ncbi:DUF1613-domain-containing protein [Piedraia hortae CBS 480.64]|uniref:tRNA (uracil-O(2)-)-methyltransferase n=1 Tax=Piedraia hortae CBS 480.64 TaxID=1314780 RepID=A0A6A7BPW6_9PEZI|nr:DUF1613-domain-containing protein [Piedraia hortae CBS 480.64]